MVNECCFVINSDTLLGEVGVSKPYKTENVSFGNSAKYRIAKLKRDHPGVADQLAAGEFKSVSAAERAAGVGKPVMQPVAKAFRAYERLTPDEQIEFRKLL